MLAWESSESKFLGLPLFWVGFVGRSHWLAHAHPAKIRQYASSAIVLLAWCVRTIKRRARAATTQSLFLRFKFRIFTGFRQPF
jgi:hypothetical protein